MNEKEMAQSTAWWEDLIKWVEGNWFQIGIIGLLSRGIDKTFKYLSEGRDGRTREIVKEEMKPFSEKLDDIADAIYDLKTHK